jgi:uncharacterized SAM-binding protein YcdF (DUF218 family)
VGIVLLVVVVVFAAATARLFIWPEEGMPARVDAIVMMNGQGDRLASAVKLAREHRAPVLVIARGSAYWGQGSRCAPAIPGVRAICFDPDPDTTQGEAEFAGQLAKRYHWRSVVLVTTTPQDTRARLRVGRCFSGDVYVVNAFLHRTAWPAAIAYEWGALIKAEFFQRHC